MTPRPKINRIVTSSYRYSTRQINNGHGKRTATKKLILVTNRQPPTPSDILMHDDNAQKKSAAFHFDPNKR
jgi:hypothetical protein